jgi:hypothetical protein
MSSGNNSLMVGKKSLKTGKNKPGSNCQALNIPMKWAIFVISLLS